jgi:Interferon-induced transmembrane protein
MTGYDQTPPDQGQQWNAPGGPEWGPQQSGPYQSGPYQGGPYQGGPYQGGPYQGGPYSPQSAATIKTYRTQAVIVLLCCILFGILPLITGIPALIYSTRVTENITRGDFAKAVEASRRARMLCWISLGIILLMLVIFIIIGVVAASHGTATNTGVTGNTGGVTGNTGAANT